MEKCARSDRKRASSTARDMAIITLALKRHFPDYYNLFSRIRTNAGVEEVAHSGRYLGNVRGASFLNTDTPVLRVQWERYNR